jgi:hypothetical protein
MIKISKINWLSEEAKEAEVYLFDGRFNIISFSHPFNQAVGETVQLPLYALDAKNIYRLNGEEKCSVEKVDDVQLWHPIIGELGIKASIVLMFFLFFIGFPPAWVFPKTTNWIFQT